MKNVILLSIPFIAVGLFEIPGLVKKKYWRELFVFSVLFLIAFVFSVLLVLGVKIPRPIFFGL